MYFPFFRRNSSCIALQEINASSLFFQSFNFTIYQQDLTQLILTLTFLFIKQNFKALDQSVKWQVIAFYQALQFSIKNRQSIFRLIREKLFDLTKFEKSGQVFADNSYWMNLVVLLAAAYGVANEKSNFKLCMVVLEKMDALLVELHSQKKFRLMEKGFSTPKSKEKLNPFTYSPEGYGL